MELAEAVLSELRYVEPPPFKYKERVVFADRTFLYAVGDEARVIESSAEWTYVEVGNIPQIVRTSALRRAT